MQVAVTARNRRNERKQFKLPTGKVKETSEASVGKMIPSISDGLRAPCAFSSHIRGMDFEPLCSPLGKTE
jgi:hypothetical protein